MADDLAAVGRDLTRAAKAAPGLAERALQKVADDIVRTAQGLAKVDTGFLRSSITAQYGDAGDFYTLRAGESAVTIGPSAEYGIYVELGTSRVPPAPFMQPAFDQHAPKLEAALEQIARL